MMNIYVIQDNVSKQCSPLFLHRNVESARREFSSFLAGIPFDSSNYDMYELGEFNDEPISAKANSEARHICNGATLRPATVKAVEKSE